MNMLGIKADSPKFSQTHNFFGKGPFVACIGLLLAKQHLSIVLGFCI